MRRERTKEAIKNDKAGNVNLVGKLLTVAFSAYVYAIEDWGYQMMSQKQLKKKRHEARDMYEDTTNPLWKRALGKARLQTKRFENNKELYELRRNLKKMVQNNDDYYNIVTLLFDEGKQTFNDLDEVTETNAEEIIYDLQQNELVLIRDRDDEEEIKVKLSNRGEKLFKSIDSEVR